MIIDHFEQLINKFVAVFLLPLINITIISLFIYWVTNASGSLIGIISGKEIQGIVGPFLSDLLQGQFDDAVKFAREHVKELESASFFLLSTISIFVVFFVYLFDRMIFGLGHLIPITFKFDLNAYAKQNKNNLRMRWVEDLTKPMPDFAFAYGGIRAYLGEKNSDQNRQMIRNKLVRALTRVKVVTLYAKSYSFLCICLLVIPSTNGLFLPMRVLTAIAILFFVLVVSFLLYSYFWKKLVEYDVDSFLWDRCYKPDQAVKGLSLREDGTSIPPAKRTYRERIRKKFSKWPRFDKTVVRLGTFFQRSCLRIALFEDVKA